MLCNSTPLYWAYTTIIRSQPIYYLFWLIIWRERHTEGHPSAPGQRKMRKSSRPAGIGEPLGEPAYVQNQYQVHAALNEEHKLDVIQ